MRGVAYNKKNFFGPEDSGRVMEKPAYSIGEGIFEKHQAPESP